MSSLSNKLRGFLYRHSHVVDFLSASLIISLCLIVLLPKVHDSFQRSSSNSPIQQPKTKLQDAGEKQKLEPPDESQIGSGNDHHHHQHGRVPIGELFICAGFFVFYCIGLGLGKSSQKGEREPLLIAKRTYNYYTEELQVTRGPIDDNSGDMLLESQEFQNNTLKWPLSGRVFLLAFLLALTLIVFDLNIHGLMEAIKVFRATATGALLYLAFFLILPKTPDCKVCFKPSFHHTHQQGETCQEAH